MWWCLCDCQLKLPKEKQKLKIVSQQHLTTGRAKSCGCNQFRFHPNFQDLTGHTFGKFKVIKRVERPEGCKISGAYWLCECECGNQRIYRSIDITQERALSCGECSKNKFDISGPYGIGYTANNQQFYFDLEDYDKIKQYTWCLNPNGYVVAWDRHNAKHIYMHRLVTGVDCSMPYDVDHQFHNKNDNRKEYLRICTHQENVMNSKISKNNTSGVTGVVWINEIKKWRAQITVNNKNIHILTHEDFDIVVQARRAAEVKYFGMYAYDDNTMKGNINND